MQLIPVGLRLLDVNIYKPVKTKKKTFSFLIFLLQLRDRMNQWNDSPDFQRIGDIIVKFSPFFKMYTEYVKNFDNAINTINNMYQKNSKFANIMDEIHVSLKKSYTDFSAWN